MQQTQNTSKLQSSVRRRAIWMYFCTVLIISYGSYIILRVLEFLHAIPVSPASTEYILFPVMDIGVMSAGLIFMATVRGGAGVRDIFTRLGRWRVHLKWYAVSIFLPPAVMLFVLAVLHAAVSPVFTPGLFLIGSVFGAPALLEEIGWTGFAFPMLRTRWSALVSAIILGLLWGLWHAPVVDYLGTAVPHRAYWAPFFLAFIAIVMAMRVLIAWVYTHANSVLLAWLMHMSMTSSLVVLDPKAVSPAQETLWYFAYAAALWIVVGVVVLYSGKGLKRDDITRAP